MSRDRHPLHGFRRSDKSRSRWARRKTLARRTQRNFKAAAFAPVPDRKVMTWHR